MNMQHILCQKYRTQTMHKYAFSLRNVCNYAQNVQICSILAEICTFKSINMLKYAIQNTMHSMQKYAKKCKNMQQPHEYFSFAYGWHYRVQNIQK